MSLTIRDAYLGLDLAPIATAPIRVYATQAPLLELVNGVWIEVQATYAATRTDVAGLWSFTLPWPSQSDPSSVQFQIRFPDGVLWQGHVPEGIAGPVNLKTLKDTYGWGVVAGGISSTVLAIQGTPGAAGPLVTWRGAWSSVTAYVQNDAVSYSGSSYLAVAGSTNLTPDTHPGSWALIAAAGSAGSQGIQGIQGNPGQGVPTGGTTAQVLAKASNTNYDTQWTAAGSGGTVSDATTTTPGIVEVDHAPSGAHPVALTTDGPTATTALQNFVTSLCRAFWAGR